MKKISVLKILRGVQLEKENEGNSELLKIQERKREAIKLNLSQILENNLLSSREKVSCKMLEKEWYVREIAFGRRNYDVAKIVFASMTRY